jgi:serine/threonine protein kinase
LQGLEYLHNKCKIIHTDVKPENILIVYSDPSINHKIDEAVKAKLNLKDRGFNWFPDSYGELASLPDPESFPAITRIFILSSPFSSSVSTLEKCLKKSPSPSTNTSSTTINPINAHDEDVVKTSTASVDYNFIPIANSLDLSSDDDPFDKTAGASSSTTTSSLIFDSKNLASSDDENLGLRTVTNLSLSEQQFRKSNNSLNILTDVELDSFVHDKNLRQTVSTPYRHKSLHERSAAAGSDSELFKFPPFSKNSQGNHKSKISSSAHKDISYSSALQGLLNNANVRVKIADLGNACFDVRFNDVLSVNISLKWCRSAHCSIITSLKTSRRGSIAR